VSLKGILMADGDSNGYDYDGEFIVGIIANLLFFLGSLDQDSWVNSPEQMYQIALHAEEAAKFMEERWGLRVSAGHVRQLHYMLDEMTSKGEKPIGTPSIHDQVLMIRAALHIELESTVFVYVPSSAAHYFRDPLQDVSEDIRTNFSSTLYDFTEAAKCLAVSRSTACVSHCMRVLEVGLIALGNALGVAEAQNKNWNMLLDQIEKRIKAIGPHDGADWREQQEFYSSVAAHFGAIRVAWRNNVMHAHEKYTELEGREILGATRALMRRIAMKLHD
jgi:hypothetical protein